jgi:serine/threonine-protein kinase RIO1
LQLALLQLRGTGTLYHSPIISVSNTKPLEIPKLSTETLFPQSDSKQPVALPKTAMRLGRLGLGPPKRARGKDQYSKPIKWYTLKYCSIFLLTIEFWIDDSTVPRSSISPSPSRTTSNNGSSQKSNLSGSPLNNLARNRHSGHTGNEVVGYDEDDKENMSLTMVDPVHVSSNKVTTGLKTAKADEPAAAKLRSVKINGRCYKVLHLIGRGGSSKVFKVLAPDNQILALKKVSLKNLDENTLNGYTNEINLLKHFSKDEHIIKLIDSELNREHENLYILMEYGEADLGKLLKLREGKPRDYNFIRFSWQQMLIALKTVHQSKIVHCDLKPANFLLVQGVLKLIDFGISKAIMNDTTNIVRENQVGTVNYMSPEALQESSATENGRIKIGRPSDVWSLGCILYEMTYGKPPFAQFTLIHRLQRIMDSNYQIDFPEIDNHALLDVIKSCLNRHLKQRITLEQLLVHPFLVPHLPVAPSSKGM